MINPIIIVLFLATLGQSFASQPEQHEIRARFVKATQQPDYRSTFYELVSNANPTNFHSAYLGAAKTLMAENSVSPFAKLSLFNDGKTLIEEAINEQPDEAEFRYLRFLVQFKAPAFLGYNHNIKSDYLFVKSYIEQTSIYQESWIDYFKQFERIHADELSTYLEGA
ncbi:MAG: hypothetical protein WEC59_06425 [Salibacteraceae bacterium]